MKLQTSILDRIKKIGIIVAAAVVVVIAAVILLPILLQQRGQRTILTSIIEKTKLELDKVDIEAAVRTEQAKSIEQTKIDELKRISEIRDSRKRRERLAELLKV